VHLGSVTGTGPTAEAVRDSWWALAAAVGIDATGVRSKTNCPTLTPFGELSLTVGHWLCPSVTGRMKIPRWIGPGYPGTPWLHSGARRRGCRCHHIRVPGVAPTLPRQAWC